MEKERHPATIDETKRATEYHRRMNGSSDIRVIMKQFDFSTKARRKEGGVFLDTVWQGLEYLCEQVERAEKERANSHGSNFAGTDFGDQPDDAMVCNYFLWYANALYNFIGVFNEAFSLTEDLNDEFANVILWRNKIAAHTAWASPLKGKKADNAATQDMSIVLFLEFNFKFDGHFEVGGFRVFSVDTGESSPEWQWGLVRTHQRLKEIVSKYGAATTPTPLLQRETAR